MRVAGELELEDCSARSKRRVSARASSCRARRRRWSGMMSLPFGRGAGSEAKGHQLETIRHLSGRSDTVIATAIRIVSAACTSAAVAIGALAHVCDAMLTDGREELSREAVRERRCEARVRVSANVSGERPSGYGSAWELTSPRLQRNVRGRTESRLARNYSRSTRIVGRQVSGDFPGEPP